MKNSNEVLYIIKNILFLLFILGCINLLPNLNEVAVVGTIFIIVIIIFSLLMFYSYVIKEKKLINNVNQSILTILLYIYVFIISQKYLQSVNSIDYSIDNMYFIINYIIILISMIGIIFNNLLILSTKNKNVI